MLMNPVDMLIYDKTICIFLIIAIITTYTEVKFINASMSTLGALDKFCDSLLAVLSDLDTA